MAETGGGKEIGVRTVLLLCIAGAVLFSLALYRTIEKSETSFGDEPGSTTFSTSALGHSALFELLNELKIPAGLYRYSSGALAKRFYGNLVVLAEPGGAVSLDQGLRGVTDAVAILIVLPKRIPDGFSNGNRIVSSDILSVVRVEETLKGTVENARVVRPSKPEGFDTNRLGITPRIKSMQLIIDSKLTPIISGPSGMLVGEMRRGRARVWILSDPDVIANHGLIDGDNAAFTVKLLETLLPKGQRVIFDETIHGFTLPPTLWLALFKPPWVVVMVAFLVLTLLLGFTALNRFGRTVEEPQALKAGKDLLIENTAGVLVARGTPGWIAMEYARTVMADVTRKLRITRTGQDDARLVDALTQAERGKKLTTPISELWTDVRRAGKEGSALDAARKVDRWRQEVLHDAR